MEVSIRELKSQLSRYLRLVKKGQELTVTSHHQPVARLTAIIPPGEGLPEVPAVRWAKGKPVLSRPMAKRPKIKGQPLADWIVENRR